MAPPLLTQGGGYKGAGGPLSPEAAKAAAKSMLPAYGWDDAQYQCLVNLWNGESGWNYAAENPDSGAYGIPQSLPADKMGSIAPDWRTNAVTQIKWGLEYIKTVKTMVRLVLPGICGYHASHTGTDRW